MLVRRHAPLNSPPKENPRKKLSSRRRVGHYVIRNSPTFKNAPSLWFRLQRSFKKRDRLSIGDRLSLVKRSLIDVIHPKEIVYPSKIEASEPFGWLKRRSKDTNNHHKKEKQNSSELAKQRRSPTACFGLNRKQEIESYATRVVDSHPENGDCGAKATQEIDTDCLNQNVNHEFVTTQLVEVHPVGIKCGEQATQEIKRKLNPFVTDC